MTKHSAEAANVNAEAKTGLIVCVCVCVCVCVYSYSSTHPVCGHHSNAPQLVSHVVIKDMPEDVT